MLKVHISPELNDSPYGIRRVIEALHKHLPEFGVQPVGTPEEADVINAHAMMRPKRDGKPLVHTSHGLYWADHHWPMDHVVANQQMIDTMSQSQAITAPSEWVANSIRRGMLRNPEVIYHGVDTEEWTPLGDHKGYVLWNKARHDVVSNVDELIRLTELMPDQRFVSTLGKSGRNLQVTGTVSHDTMKEMVRQAGVYLATARETFGIGTLEALACGIPVAGWYHGGQREIIRQGETGYLAMPGDYDGLVLAIKKCFAERDRLSANARKDAVERWGWPKRIEQYANVFKAVHEEWTAPRPTVSIIITAHNLGRYLTACLESVKRQSGDWECLIVDDSSTDNTAEIALAYQAEDHRFIYYPTPSNLKLSGARNFGVSRATGRYIIPLDADDMLSDNAIETLAGALDADPTIHIAYGHLDVISEDGSGLRRNDWPFEQFNWYGQMAHLNQLPYCAMMRREVLVNSGGYRVRDWRAEDAALWCRVTSFGYRAKKVTETSTLIYRTRSDSKSAMERQRGADDGDWTSWTPWRIAGSVPEGRKALAEKKRPLEALVPFGAQGKNIRFGRRFSWPVWSHHDPVVSVIIPVGPGHQKYLYDSLDSLVAQTFPFWEVIVANDTGEPLDLKFAPYARIVTTEHHGVAHARNTGLRAARAPLVLFLDADDLLLPSAIFDMITAYVAHDGNKYIYTDWYAVNKAKVEVKGSRDYDQHHWSKEGLHPVTALVSKKWAEGVGRFDPDLPGWEDWDFYIKMAIKGYCGYRLKKPLLVYRLHAGQRREQSLDDGRKTLPILKERYAVYFDGGKQMAGCCGSGDSAVLLAKRQLGMLPREPRLIPQRGDNGMIRIEYTGSQIGTIQYSRIAGKELSRVYRLGNNNLHRYADATAEDAKLLVSSGLARYVKPEAGIDLSQAAVPQFDPPPAPEVQVEEFVDEPIVEPEAAPEVPDVPEGLSQEAITAISELSVPALGERSLTLSLEDLKRVLAAEKTGRARKTAISLLETSIEDAERILSGVS